MARSLSKGLLLAMAVLSLRAQAANTPLELAIFPPLQFPSNDYVVKGLRVGVLWGNQNEMYGLDLGGIGNVTQTAFQGAALSGIFNLNNGSADVYFFQIAGLANVNGGETSVTGLQASLALNYNIANASVYGIEIAPVNLTQQTKVYGFQVGIFNRVDSIYGFQIGLINMAKNVHGLQIGFLNFNETGFFQVSPVLNFGF